LWGRSQNKTTSQFEQPPKGNIEITSRGGNPDGGWYHIPGGERDWFKLDTWLLFDDPQELLAKDLLALKDKGEIKAVGILRHDIANAICNCMRRCDDVSEYHKGLLGSTRQPPKK
jgi:hypothetical protein